MANPKTNTLTDIFLNDGFGFFGFGDGGFGGSDDLLNPQWNTNSGSFGFDPIQLLPYVEATDTPSYVGAALYDLESSSFFAKITPAPAGFGGTQTGLLIRFDRHNYVEMSYGPNGQFNAYVSNDSNITVAAMPAYNATTHAYWRIRNIDRVNMYFDTSPDGVTWTQQGFVPYAWDASSVTVSIFAGFTGLENPGNFAYISNVNIAGTNLALSAKVTATASASGFDTVSDPHNLAGSVHGSANLRGSFKATLGIPEGGLSDFIYTSKRGIDTMITNAWKQLTFTNTVNITTVTQGSWTTASSAYTVPGPYRDGSYWPNAAYGVFRHRVITSADTGPDLVTDVQVEPTTGLNNRLPLDASIYADFSAYAPSAGASSLVRSTDIALNGQYSGKLTSNATPDVIGDGSLAYFMFPQSLAIIPVRKDGSGNAESLFGTVYLSTQRASTSWFASFIYYDSSFNILSHSTYRQGTITNRNTHPGGGVWQPGSVFDNTAPNTASYVAIVPVIQNPSSLVESVYVSNHSITTASARFTEVATAYQNPRTAEINVKADRVNYVRNAGFNAGSTEWLQSNVGTTGTPNPASQVWDNSVGYKSVGSLRMDVVPISGTFTGPGTATLGLGTRATFSNTSSARTPVVRGLKPGHTYTVTAWVNQGDNCPDIFMDFVDANGVGIKALSINTQRITNPENVDGNWTRMQSTYTVPPTGLIDYRFYFYVKFSDLASAPFSFWIDSLLVEETDTYKGFFDGGFASSDYKWESGGAVNLSRSYYYKDYANKFLRLNRAISSVLPVGESYELLFAQPLT